MLLSRKQMDLLYFVKIQHGDQKRKYTGDPYWNHVYRVALTVSQYDKGGVEVALCHDLFEDTECNFSVLYKELIDLDYNREAAYDICTRVTELTDKFIHTDYPNHNRKQRKKMEAERLGKISPLSQTVKYADLLDNTASITEHDPDFSKVYLKEKKYILELMVDGDKELLKLCKESIDK